jgi:D-alanyl-D-alanine carboxypeptidase (penicillin-binding protein 5/6)
MKRLLMLALLVLALGFAAETMFSKPSPAGIRIEASRAILIDADTGETLYAKNEQDRAYPASTTKILTALLALELGNLQETVTVGREVEPIDPEESRAGLHEGQRIRLYDLVQAAMLPSGNDAARAIAVHIGRKASQNPGLGIAEAQNVFAGLMNERAKSAGARHSHFANPHGLHDPNHYSTAGDLAKIAREAMKNELFADIAHSVSHKAAVAEADGSVTALTVANRNQLIIPGSENFMKEATGIKTGFTDQAGYCLVSSAERNGRTLIAVVLDSTAQGVYNDTKLLIEYGFNKLKSGFGRS